MKRLLIIFLTIALLLVSGCSADNGTINNENSRNTQDTSATKDISLSDDIESLPEKETATPAFNESTAGNSPTTEKRSDTNTVVNTPKIDTPPPNQTHDTFSPTNKIPIQTPNVQTPNRTAYISSPPITSPPMPEEITPEPTQVTTDSTQTKPPQTTSTPKPDMGSEYGRIINETIAYAESYTSKGFTFIWDDTLKFGWETGYMGTPRVKCEGVEGVISILKHHVDKIVNTVTDPSNGIPSVSANYKVMQITVDGDIAFVVLYG